MSDGKRISRSSNSSRKIGRHGHEHQLQSIKLGHQSIKAGGGKSLGILRNEGFNRTAIDVFHLLLWIKITMPTM
jgi:hypothetical protein